MINEQGLTGAIAKNVQGSILPMGAIGFVVLAALIGGGVDMSRAYKAKSRLQAACDAGALAGRRAVITDGFDVQAQGQANSFFAINYDNDREGTRDTIFLATSDDDGQTITATATSTIDTIVMNIFGFANLDVAVDCTASMGIGNSDITMVLDTTGSMGWAVNGARNPPLGESRLENLQVAMTNFYDTVDAAMSSSNARVRYAFVPYSNSVNAGQIIADLNPNFLVSTYDIQSRVWVRWSSPVSSSSTSSTSSTTTIDNRWRRIGSPSYTYSSSCYANLPDDTEWQDYGGLSNPPPTFTITNSGQKEEVTSSVQEQRKLKYSCFKRRSNNRYYVYYKRYSRSLSDETTTFHDAIYDIDDPSDPGENFIYQQVQYDVSDYTAFNTAWTLTGISGGNPAWESSVWNGCIEERQTVSSGTFTFVPGTGITPSGALDLDIDSAPDVFNDATKWAPMWPDIAYSREADEIFAKNGSDVNDRCPFESQLLAELSESDFDDYANSLVAEGNTYHDIGLIWGARLSSPDGIWGDLVREAPGNGGNVSRHLIFMTDGDLAPRLEVQSSYGIEANDKRVTGNGTSGQENRHRARFLAVCQAVRDKGIRLWVIAFGVALDADLTTCASANSAFGADNATQLNTAFQEIANQVGELRVTQ